MRDASAGRTQPVRIAVAWISFCNQKAVAKRRGTVLRIIVDWPLVDFIRQVRPQEDEVDIQRPFLDSPFSSRLLRPVTAWKGHVRAVQDQNPHKQSYKWGPTDHDSCSIAAGCYQAVEGGSREAGRAWRARGAGRRQGLGDGTIGRGIIGRPYANSGGTVAIGQTRLHVSAHRIALAALPVLLAVQVGSDGAASLATFTGQPSGRP